MTKGINKICEGVYVVPGYSEVTMTTQSVVTIQELALVGVVLDSTVIDEVDADIVNDTINDIVTMRKETWQELANL